MTRLTMVVALLLGGCAAWQRAHEPTQQVRTVEVPTAAPVPCVAAEDIPPPTQTALPDPDADVARKAAGASADVRALVQERDKLRALLIKCTEVAK